eukprot:8270650-Ditylum_brightwellii.AAC.1
MTALGKVIVEEHGVVKGERPKVSCDLFRPMEHGVDQHRATPRGDGFDGAFCHPILVVRIDAAE